MLLKTKCDHLHHACADGLAPWWWRWSRRAFSLFTAYQILSSDFYFKGVLTTAWRRVTIQHLQRKERCVILSSDHIVWPCNLLCDWPHNYRRFPSGRPHVAIAVFLPSFLFFSSLPTESFSSAFFTSKWWPHIIFSDTDLTTSLTINRTGVDGDKSVREYEKAVFA